MGHHQLSRVKQKKVWRRKKSITIEPHLNYLSKPFDVSIQSIICTVYHLKFKWKDVEKVR